MDSVDELIRVSAKNIVGIISPNLKSYESQ